MFLSIAFKTSCCRSPAISMTESILCRALSSALELKPSLPNPSPACSSVFDQRNDYGDDSRVLSCYNFYCPFYFFPAFFRFLGALSYSRKLLTLLHKFHDFLRLWAWTLKLLGGGKYFFLAVKANLFLR